MKKIFYLIFLISLYFLVNVNVAEAEDVQKICYYKTAHSEITFAVKNYRNGEADAILMNSYSEDDFGENQSYRATWDKFGSSLIDGECADYMKYKINLGFLNTNFSGDNEISYSNDDNLQSDDENVYILKNYDFESISNKCTYYGVEGHDKDEQTELTVFFKDNSIFTYFDNDYNTAMNKEITVGNSRKITYSLDNVFYDKYLEAFDNNKSCPTIVDWENSYNQPTIILTPNKDTSATTNFALKDSSGESIPKDEEIESFSFGLVNEVEGIDGLTFYVKVYSSGKEKICVSWNNGNLQCYEKPNSQTDEVVLYETDWYDVRIKIEDWNEFFQYDDSNDPSSLIEPEKAYFNLADNQEPGKTTYYLSKENDGIGIPSSDPMDYISSEKYKQLLSQLKAPLSKLDSSALDIQLTINTNKTATLRENITEDYALCEGNISDCTTYAEQLTELGLKNIQNYCIEVYNVYPKKQNDNNMQNRMEECISFNNFYRELVKRGIILDLSDGCGIISEDFAKKLNYFLDLIKIAGPLLALGLGTLDFVKTIVSGDADKEMKTTFKRFSTRLIAAVLLFLIPFILAFLLDLFIGNENGYDSDNPFCINIDWSEQ